MLIDDDLVELYRRVRLVKGEHHHLCQGQIFRGQFNFLFAGVIFRLFCQRGAIQRRLDKHRTVNFCRISGGHHFRHALFHHFLTRQISIGQLAQTNRRRTITTGVVNPHAVGAEINGTIITNMLRLAVSFLRQRIRFDGASLKPGNILGQVKKGLNIIGSFFGDRRNERA